MLLSALVALALLGPYVRSPKWRGRSGLRKLVADSFAPIAGVLVILPAAGGLSGVLRDSGAAQATVQLAMGAHIPPLILAWLLAAVVRWDRPPLPWLWPRARSRRSPVAGRRSHGGAPGDAGAGSGSLMLSHVNDPASGTPASGTPASGPSSRCSG